MQSFINWYANFDSLFLKPSHQLTYSFMNELHLGKAINLKWGQCPLLPQLPLILNDLEKLILTENWKQCFCQELESKSIEQRLNWLLILVETQKMYGRQYWQMNQRRVQASVVHYFLMLKQFFFSIIPSDCQNLLIAMQAQKLCLQISEIEKLINRLLKNLKPLYIFLHNNLFQQERLLVLQFFDSVTNFWKRLPQLSKKDLMEVPKIMMFISLNNCLESLKNQKESTNESYSRMKSKTTEKLKQKELSLKDDYDKASEIGKYKEYLGQQEQYSANNKSFAHSQLPEKSKIKIFKFKKRIFIQRILSEQKRSKVSSIASQLLHKNDTMSIKKNILGFQNVDRYRSVTIIPRNYQNQDKQSVLTNQRLTIQKKSPRIEKRDRVKTKSRQRASVFLEKTDESELERRKIKKDQIKLNKNLYSRCISNLRNYLTGQQKGWATMREHVKQKIAKSKIKRLLNS